MSGRWVLLELLLSGSRVYLLCMKFSFFIWNEEMRSCYKPLGPLKRLDVYLKILCKLESDIYIRHDQLQEMATAHNAFFLNQHLHLFVCFLKRGFLSLSSQTTIRLYIFSRLFVSFLYALNFENHGVCGIGDLEADRTCKSLFTLTKSKVCGFCLDIMSVNLLPSVI